MNRYLISLLTSQMNRRGYENASTALKGIEVNKILTNKQVYSLVFLMTRVTLIVTVRHT